MGERGGFDCRLMESNIHQLPAPSLTAIERFLWTPNDLSQKETQRSVKKKESITVGSTNGFYEFPSYCGGDASDHDHGYSSSGFGLPNCIDENGFLDGSLFLDGGSLNWMQQYHENSYDKESLRAQVRLKENKKNGKVKKLKAGSSSNMIKGQWTDEEDRLLIRLVNQYGVRKWAQIAQKLAGRAGKQCRERWHNHLRPDIKKDTWSEEEEKMLVEAHEKVGNKWAEIAKRIPGRTENAIKNHWNATKRRQNSKRKNKRAASRGGKSHPSILQDYIRSKNMMITCANSPSSTAVSTVSTTNGSNISLDPSSLLMSSIRSEPSESSVTDDSVSLIAHSYDEELRFIQRFFESIYKHPYDYNEVIHGSEDSCYGGGQFDQSPLPIDHALDLSQFIEVEQEDDDHGVMEKLDENGSNNIITSQYLYSDVYLSYLLNGVSSSSAVIDSNSQDNQLEKYLQQTDYAHQASNCGGMRDMDLMEMISSCSSSQFISKKDSK